LTILESPGALVFEALILDRYKYKEQQPPIPPYIRQVVGMEMMQKGFAAERLFGVYMALVELELRTLPEDSLLY